MRLPIIPPTIVDPMRRYLTLLSNVLTDNYKVTMTTDRPVDTVLLTSPDGSVWGLTIDDAGALVTTKLRGP